MKVPIRLAIAPIAALLCMAGPAMGQAYQCSLPAAPAAVPRVVPDGPVKRMPVAGYTLALSWSPEYCRGRESSVADRFQCSGRHGRFGLVLHGLWPDGGKGGESPQWCPATRVPTVRLLHRHMCMTPSASLLAREWTKHGACMTQTPEAYYKVSGILWDSLRLPDLDMLSRRKGLNAGMIREAFSQAFPVLEPGMVGIRLNERGWLEEVRLCYGRDFLPTRCSARQIGVRDSAPAKIWRGL